MHRKMLRIFVALFCIFAISGFSNCLFPAVCTEKTGAVQRSMIADVKGTPAASAVVKMDWRDASGTDRTIQNNQYGDTIAYTDPNGYYEINTSPGNIALCAHTAGWTVASGGTFILHDHEVKWINMTFADRENCLISGRVVDNNTNAPLGDAQIELVYGDSPDNTYTNFTFSDPTGYYQIYTGVGAVKFKVARVDYFTITQSYTITGSRTIDFRLDSKLPYHNATGVVTDSSTNNPLGGVIIFPIWLDDIQNPTKSESLPSVTTSSTGSYRIMDIPHNGYLLFYLLVPPGRHYFGRIDIYGGVTNPQRVTSDITQDFALHPKSTPQYKIDGTVSDSTTGAGVADVAVVTAWLSRNFLGVPDYERFDFNSSVSDATGYYKIDIQPPSLLSTGYIIQIMTMHRGGRYFDYSEDHTNFDMPVNADIQKDISVDPVPPMNAVIKGYVYLPAVEGTIAGTVTDASTGHPIGGAAITVYDAGTSNVVATATTALDGTYSVPVSAGTYDVEASRTGYVTNKKTGISVTAGATTIVDFQLSPTTQQGAIKGTVTDASTGNAIGGATITVYEAGTSTTVGTASTATNGSYLVTVSPGRYDVEASKTGYDISKKTGISVSAGTTTTVDFQLTPTTQKGVISGRITDASTTNALDGATVKVYAAGGDTPLYTAATASDGTYSISVDACTYDVEASKTGYIRDKKTSISVAAGETKTVDFQLTPMPQQGVIRGRITDASTANPLGDVTVKVYAANTNTVVGTTTTASNGTYSISVDAGTYDVEASKIGYIRDKKTGISVAAGETKTVDFQLTPMPQRGVIRGTITDASTANPLDGVAVKVYATGGDTPLYTAATASDGTYSISVDAGTYDVEASKTGYDINKKEGISVAAGETKTVDFALRPQAITTKGVIKGEVKDAATGNVISGAIVKVYSAGSDAVVAATTSATNGSFWIELPAGEYDVEASKEGYHPQKLLNITVSAGTEKIVLLLLTPKEIVEKGTLIVTVKDSKTDKAVENAKVEVYKKGENTVTATDTTDSNGNVTFSLDEGDYEIIVSKEGYKKSARKAVKITSGVASSVLIYISKEERQPGFEMIAVTIGIAIAFLFRKQCIRKTKRCFK